MHLRTAIIAAASCSLALTLSACGGAHDAASGDHSGSPAAASEAAASPSAAAADIAFAQLMIPHHQQAIDMAVMAEKGATTDEVRQLAAQIKGAQDPEIQTMQGWLTEWGAPTEMESMDGHEGHDMGGMSADGMMTAEDMDALAAATGPEFDQMWLEMMIAHHEGALTMAQDVLATTKDPRVRELAQSIVDGQTAEITTMKEALAG